jgi:hypothetical protein
MKHKDVVVWDDKGQLYTCVIQATPNKWSESYSLTSLNREFLGIVCGVKERDLTLAEIFNSPLGEALRD